MALVEVSDDDGVRTVTLNRPDKRNAFTTDMVVELDRALGSAADDPAVRVVVLAGSGRMFSAGMDVAGLGEETPENVRGLRRDAVRAWQHVEDMPKPTVCAVHGAAIGGALELALACDLRVMADDAVVGLPQVRVGLVPDVGGTSRLPAVVGLGRAKEIVMTGRMVAADEALAIGLVTRVVPPDELSSAVGALVAELLAGAPVALGLAKRIMDASARPTLSTSFELEAAAQVACTGTQDFTEGAAALLERRTPTFRGR